MLLHRLRPDPQCERSVNRFSAQRPLPCSRSGPGQGVACAAQRRPEKLLRTQHAPAASSAIRGDAGAPCCSAAADVAESAAAQEVSTPVDSVLDGVEAERQPEFSFRLAVALAGCAFESYSSPAIDGRELAPATAASRRDSGAEASDAAIREAAPGVLREVSVNGTETTFVSA